jgi:hypothetical protein
MRLLDAATEVVPLLKEEGRLIRLPPEQTVVFVGDTHGDSDATEKVLTRFLGENRTIVFLGDTVDRGADSAGNLELILRAKRDHPNSIFLLMGNHEAWAVATFSPADFWERLDARTAGTLADALTHLPFAASHPTGVLALHGALPDVPTLDAIASVELGSEAWRAITWGDWSETGAGSDSAGALGRPTFGRADFEARAQRLGVSVLVRSHQPFAPTHAYDDRCLTIFTSNAYGTGPRRVAVLRPGVRVRSARSLTIEGID